MPPHVSSQLPLAHTWLGFTLQAALSVLYMFYDIR